MVTIAAKAKQKYKDLPIRDVKDNTVLMAIRDVCKSALWLKQHLSVGDDGEWDYKLNKVVHVFETDLKELAEMDIDTGFKNTYQGELTVERLLSEFSDFEGLVSSTSPLGKEETRFLIGYQYLDNHIGWLRRVFAPEVRPKEYFWDDIHKSIRAVSRERYQNRQYADAVEAAFKEVIRRVKDYVNAKTGLNLDGDRVMNRAFGCDAQVPLIKFNDLSRQEEIDEQRGIMNLFKGIVGIRNRKAHENVVLDNKYRALEYLALASLLMRLLDEYAQ